MKAETTPLSTGNPYEGFYTILLWFGTPLKEILQSKAIYTKNFIMVQHGKIEKVDSTITCTVENTTFSLNEKNIRKIRGINHTSLL